MTTEFDLPCTRCGGKISPVEVPLNDQLENESEVLHLGECVECGAHHYPEQALNNLSG